MADEKKPRRHLRLAIPHPHLPHLTLKQVRVLRLFTLLFVLSVLVLYAVFRSTRFQDLLRRRSVAAIKQAIGRDAEIGGFDLSLVPPAFLVKDVRLANDPRGAKEPFFAAKEIALRGIPTIEKGQIDLPKLRIVEPEITLEVFPDGSTNVPALASASRPGEKALEVRLGEALVQRGTFRFREWKARLDVLLKDALLTARSPRFSRATRIELLCRNGRLKLEENEELRFALALEARLSPGRAHLSGFRLLSDRVAVEASGGIEDLAKPVVSLAVTARSRGEELKRLFGFGLPLQGPVSVAASVRVLPGAGFRIRGRFDLPDSRLGPFPIRGSGFIRVDPTGLLARLDRADYAGGVLQATVRLDRIDRAPLPVKVVLSGRDVSLEGFLADLDLPGTGLMSRADLESTLTFVDVNRANGVGSIRLREAAGEPSAVRGRFALPTSGGGPILIRDGRMRFARMPVRTAGGADFTFDGTLTMDGWKPDFDVALRAPDLAEVERIAANFYPAIKRAPLPVPLKLGGSGEVSGRFERDFGDPRVAGRLAATDFTLFGTRFGSADASFVVDRNVLTLSPFTARDDGGAISVSGDVAWGGALGDHYRLSRFVSTYDAWPVERVLSFLDFDLPLTGRVTGTLPLDGETPAVTGSVPLVWTDATVWGQKAERLEGTLIFEKDRLRLRGVDAGIGAGRLALSGMWRYADGAFEVDASAEAVPLGKLAGVEGSPLALGGLLTGTVTGTGTREKPQLRLRASVASPTWDGKPLSAEPATLAVDSRGGDWTARVDLPRAGRLEARSTATAGEADVRLGLESLAFLRPLVPLDPAARLDGAVDASALVTVPEDGPVRARGSFDRVRLSLFDQNLDTKEPVSFRIEDDRFTLANATITESGAPREGRALSATLGGSVGLSAPNPVDVTLSGVVDASLLRAALPGLVLAGPVAFDVKGSGPVAEPTLTGRVDLDGVDLSAPGSDRPVESITGAIRLVPGRALTDGLTMRWAGGTVDLSGSLGLKGLSLDGVRLNATASRVKFRPFEGFASTLSGTVVITGRRGPESARGELTMDRGLYDAPLDLGLGALLTKFRSPTAVGTEPTPFDDVVLDVRIEAPPRSIEVRNNVARFFASGSLTARGTFGAPVLLGEIDAEDGGRLTLRGLRYDLLKAELLFSDPVKIDPFFDLEARTRVRGSVDYDVTIGLSGTFTRVSTRLASDPPLSEAQIVSMIATGQPPSGGALGAPGGSTVSSDKSIREATRDLLTSLAADEAAERARKFFRLDRLQIDPVFAGNAFDAPRLTIGKSLTPELSVTYSYKASSNEEQIIVVDYQLTPTAAVQFLRDEDGVYSVELKLRQRLR